MPALGQQREIHTGRRVGDANNLSRLEARSPKGFHNRLGVINEALVSPVHVEPRSEYAMPSALELLHQKLPALWPLSAAMHEAVRTHCFKFSIKNSIIRS